LDKHTTGDGIVSALLVLQAACRTGKSLQELLSGVTLFPQTLINVRLKPGVDWSTNLALAKVRAEVTSELGDDGRVLIRASGTEPLVRVMVEARNPAQALSCAQRMAESLA
jgi:phosphoglucosamine mutase